MQYRDLQFRYDADDLSEPDSESVRQNSDGKQYKQKRSAHPKRRRSAKAAHPGCGISARRNKRFTW